jgi:hypothetical protein
VLVHHTTDTDGDEVTVEAGKLGPMGFFWSFGDICCHPCQNKSKDYWAGRCDANFSECLGTCSADYTGCF